MEIESMRHTIRVVLIALAAALAPTTASAGHGAVFEISLGSQVDPEDATGRLVVYLIRQDTGIERRTKPAEGPFLSSPQAIFALDVSNANAWNAENVVIDDTADWFLHKPSELPPGKYKAQVVLDKKQSDSAWYRETGNWFSKTAEFRLYDELPSTKRVPLVIDQPVMDRGPVAGRGFDSIEIVSGVLSQFYDREARLRAALVLPKGYTADRKYPVIYIIPGFGGDDSRAYREQSRREREGLLEGEHELAKNSLLVYLNPEGPNGHHLFADSANNGPVGTALVRELIPAIEQKFSVIAEPSARLVTGHSSGGWSAVWLGLHHMDVFGGAWASAPDPVDFRSFQGVNLYEDANIYEAKTAEQAARAGVEIGQDLPSRRNKDAMDLTIRAENRMEQVLAPGGKSGQQWDSWQAVFGPRKDQYFHGVSPLFDAETGEIDHKIAEQYRKYDIGALTRTNPEWYTKLFESRIRIVAGEQDEYLLDESLKLLKTAVDASGVEDGPGYITIVEGYGHLGVRESKEWRAFPKQMLEYLREQGHIQD
jgi:hypothetical protein